MTQETTINIYLVHESVAFGDLGSAYLYICSQLWALQISAGVTHMLGRGRRRGGYLAVRWPRMASSAPSERQYILLAVIEGTAMQEQSH